MFHARRVNVPATEVSCSPISRVVVPHMLWWGFPFRVEMTEIRRLKEPDEGLASQEKAGEAKKLGPCLLLKASQAYPRAGLRGARRLTENQI